MSERSCVNIRLSFLLRFTYSKLFSVFANTFYSWCRVNPSSKLCQALLSKELGVCFPAIKIGVLVEGQNASLAVENISEEALKNQGEQDKYIESLYIKLKNSHICNFTA